MMLVWFDSVSCLSIASFGFYLLVLMIVGLCCVLFGRFGGCFCCWWIYVSGFS